MSEEHKGRIKAFKKRSKAVYVPAYSSVQMEGSVRRQVLFWMFALVLLIAFLFVFSSILLPFVAGMVLAYFLNPIVEIMEKLGISRTWGTVLITIFIIVLLVVLLTILVPLISSQIQEFISNGLPIYVDRIQRFFAEHSFDWIRSFFGGDPQTIPSNIQALLGQSSDVVKSLLNSLLSSGKSIVNIFSLMIVAPVVAFYLLLDWDRMIDSIDSWIPRDYLQIVRGIFYEMDRAVAGFIRGQGTVCIILSIYYAVGLTIAGLNFGLIIGILVGLLSFIPYIGTTSGLVFSVGVAWVQYYPDNWAWIIVVLCIFLFGQFVEGYILQPKLVGSSVGLHPVWLMFALFAFAYLFGFTGMLISVPAAAALGVLVRFALHVYLKSPMFSPKNLEKSNE